ncbi:hypothetical protein [Staphylococcus xylosus]|uniref:hypothetical protein n=1 Tax=Staphylococcus xylosus TaxID=1288 RepID=UPI0011CB06E3|nr:hypothetical protein [Staphylococcus xylosus]
MNNTENFKKYPKILKIDNKGYIMGLDKNGSVNTDFNTNNIDHERFRNVFGESYNYLHDKYVNEHLSRFDKNKDSYNDNDNPNDLYTERDREYGNQQREELAKNKTAKKWLASILAIVVVGFIIFLVYNHFSNQNDMNNNAQGDNSDQLQQENEQLKQDMKDTQNKLADSETDSQKTQQEINNLQSRIDNLKNNEQVPSNQDSLQSYQDGINKLQDAQNSKSQGNYEEVKSKVSDLDKYIDKKKLTEDGKNAWDNFKNWLNEQF